MSLVIHPYQKKSGPQNMSTDWWLFQNLQSNDLIFRHYGWHKNEISFGYGQNWNWVKEQDIPDSNLLTRRPTGGGIVHHGKDWTYTLIIPSNHLSFRKAALDHYEEIHFSLGKALYQQGIKTTLMPCPSKEEKRKGIPGDCFLEPVGKDLMHENGLSKIAGAAMKRTKRGILIQGTVDLTNYQLNLNQFFDSFVKEIENLFSEERQTREWPQQLLAELNQIITQFSSQKWREQRKFN